MYIIEIMRGNIKSSIICVFMSAILAFVPFEIAAVELGFMSTGYMSVGDNGDDYVFVDTETDFDARQFVVADSIYFENRGVFSAEDFALCENCTVSIQNSGIFDADINVGSGTVLTQVVKSVDEMAAHLNVSVGRAGDGTKLGAFNLLVTENEAPFMLSDIVDFANGYADLDNLHFHDVALRMDATFADINADVSFSGTNNVLYFADMADLGSDAILDGVSADTKFAIVVENLDSLHLVSAAVRDGKLYADILRETNYMKIMGNEMGAYLDTLRVYNPDDKLLAALDGAETMAGINKILNRSVRTNPINLMRPVNVFDYWVMTDALVRNVPTGIDAGGIYMASGDFTIFGARANIAANVSDVLQIGAAGYLAVMDYDGELDDFSATMYGANIAAKYNGSLAFARAVAGFTGTRFDISSVFANGRATEDPTGYSLYIGGDVGHDFVVKDNFHLRPFVGGTAFYSDVADMSDFAGAGHVGGEFMYTFETMGIIYNYGVALRYNTDGRLSGEMSGGFWSRGDDIGADISVRVIDDDIATSYAASFGIKLRF